MIDENVRRYILDEDHLKLLSLGYMVAAGFHALFSLFGLFYVFMGFMFSAVFSQMPKTNPQDQMPPAFGWIFVFIGLMFMAVLLTIGALQFFAARKLKERRGRVFIMVAAAFTCLGFPYGTFLGVMTFIVLGRSSVVHLFGEQPALPVTFISPQ
jgi:hypothetical protein